MNRQDPFDRLLDSLHDAAFDDALWPAAARLIEEACGATGSTVIVAGGAANDERVFFGACFRRGERRDDLERDYFDNYFRRDERVPRLRRLRDGKLVHAASLYSAGERKTSATWNEALPRYGTRNGLNVRLQGLHGLRLAWGLADPVTGEWSSDRIRTVRRLLPHLRSFVHVRQALADAEARGSPLVRLLDNHRVGVIHLDRRGRIVEANDRARDLLRQNMGLWQRHGILRARFPEDDARLSLLVAAALPARDAQPAGGSMLVRHPLVASGLTLHVHPVTLRQMDFGALGVGALVLIAGPGLPTRLDPALVGTALGLTPGREPRGDRARRGQDRARHRDRVRTRRILHSHLPQAHPPQAGRLAAGAPGAAGPVGARLSGLLHRP